VDPWRINVLVCKQQITQGRSRAALKRTSAPCRFATSRPRGNQRSIQQSGGGKPNQGTAQIPRVAGPTRRMLQRRPLPRRHIGATLRRPFCEVRVPATVSLNPIVLTCRETARHSLKMSRVAAYRVRPRTLHCDDIVLHDAQGYLASSRSLNQARRPFGGASYGPASSAWLN
jgi:hypothetical protein